MKSIRLTALLLSFFLLVSVCPRVSAAEISAQAYVVMEADSGEIFAAQNADLRLPCASTTKIMTALLVLESLSPEKTVTISESHTLAEGSKMYLRAGETVSVSDLLYGLLLASGNDAALALAEAAAGSVEAFVARMNEKAVQLGLENTHFQNPSGLPDEAHYSSAKDLAILMAEAMRNEAFARICGTREAVLDGRTVVNHNRLLHTVEGVDGGKTGYTKAAGRCLVSTAIRSGRRLVVVTLNAPDDWDDHKTLYDSAFARFETLDLPSLLPELSLRVVGGDCDTVPLLTDAAEIALTAEERKRLQIVIELPRFDYAPLAFGTAVGRVVWMLDGRSVASAELRLNGSAAVQTAPTANY